MAFIMAALYEGVMSIGVQLWIIVSVVILILFRKFLVAKTKNLVSRTLHVGNLIITANCPPPNSHDRYSFAIAIQSCMLKIILPCPRADTSGPMAKAIQPNF
jgi:hypothetical protein